MSNTSPPSCVPFERSASVYDIVHSGKSYDREANAAAHHLLLNPTSRVIEFGCGTGEFTRRMVERCDTILATDPCQQMLSIARRKTWGDDPKALYAVASIQDAPNHDLRLFYGQSHAALCMYGAMSYAAASSPCEIENCLKSARATLYHDGRFVFDVLNYACCSANFRKSSRSEHDLPNGSKLLRIMRKTFRPHDSIVDIDIEFTILGESTNVQWTENHKMRAFTPSEIQSAASHAGFRVESQFPAPNRFDEFDSVFVSESDYYFWNVLVAR